MLLKFPRDGDDDLEPVDDYSWIRSGPGPAVSSVSTSEVTRDRWRRRELSRTPFGAKFGVSQFPPPPQCLHEPGGFPRVVEDSCGQLTWLETTGAQRVMTTTRAPSAC